MKNNLCKVFLSVVVLVSILVAMDFLLGWSARGYIKWLNRMPHDGDAALVSYNLNAAAPDVAIIGSSTAICHYNPDIIHDSLLSYLGEDLSVFNMGMSNQRMAYDYYGLKCLLERTDPEIVIVDVWASYLGEGDPSFSFGAYRPYASINPNVKELLVKHDKYDFLMKSNMYCFNTELVKLIMSVFRTTNVNGFTRSSVEMSNVVKDKEIDTTSLLPLSVEEFDSMLAMANEHKTMLFVVLSPTLCSADTTSQSYRYMRKRCREMNVPFLDYSNDEQYYTTHYFRDKTHLNTIGAELFIQNLMNDIKSYFSRM